MYKEPLLKGVASAAVWLQGSEPPYIHTLYPQMQRPGWGRVQAMEQPRG
uniref:Uncharacterized protein n=1 Tax=Candidozyma auris TaxID=498019 RepID=A0A0L0P2M9_CANAR